MTLLPAPEFTARTWRNTHMGQRRAYRCPCGATIAIRNIHDAYRLTPLATEIRQRWRLGVQPSWLKTFLDQCEAATDRGIEVLRFADYVAPDSPRYAPGLTLLRRCRAAGYLKYVCPQCTRPITLPIKPETPRPIGQGGRRDSAQRTPAEGKLMEPETPTPGTIGHTPHRRTADGGPVGGAGRRVGPLPVAGWNSVAGGYVSDRRSRMGGDAAILMKASNPA